MEMRNKKEHVKNATTRFFAENGLEQVLADFFNGATIKQLLTEGYQSYQNILSEAKKTAPDEIKEIAVEVAEMFEKTQEDFEKELFEDFKKRFGEILLPAAAFIPVKEQVLEVLQNHEDENLQLLVMTAMSDMIEMMTSRYANIVRLRMEGLPIEVAEHVADMAGNSEVISIGVEIHHIDDDDEEEDDDEHDHCCCNGECGGRCQCDGKCEENGHCKHEGGCNCGGDAE